MSHHGDGSIVIRVFLIVSTHNGHSSPAVTQAVGLSGRPPNGEIHADVLTGGGGGGICLNQSGERNRSHADQNKCDCFQVFGYPRRS